MKQKSSVKGLRVKFRTAVNKLKMPKEFKKQYTTSCETVFAFCVTCLTPECLDWMREKGPKTIEGVPVKLFSDFGGPRGVRWEN
jgi:hypothetical protein